MDSGSTPPPAAIGRFRIDAILGRGGMGEVYKAFDPTLQRTVAVKTVRPDIDRPELLERMLREAQAGARLRHRNIVTVYEAGEIDNVVYIVMEYLQGEDLAAKLRRGTLSFSEKIRILIQILEALQHTHAEGVIHRDMKPSNVHCEPDGTVKVVDFGLARVVEASTLTMSGTLMCTPDYASPEQLREQPLDGRTDIYSTGALAYEMFTGRRPFQGETGSVGALVLRAVSEPPPPMTEWWCRRFPEIEQIVLRAMAKSPSDRYQSADEMRQALTAFVASAGDRIAKAQADFDAGDRGTDPNAQTVVTASDSAQAATIPARPGVTAGTTPGATGTTAAVAGGGATVVRTATLAGTTATVVGQPGTVAGLPDTSATTMAAGGRAGAVRGWWLGGLGAAAAVIAIVAIMKLPGGEPAAQPGNDVSAAGGVSAPRDAAGGSTAAGSAAAGVATAGDNGPTIGAPKTGGPGAGGSTAGVNGTGVRESVGGPAAATTATPGAGTPANASTLAAAAANAETARDVRAKALFERTSGASTEGVNAGLRFRLTRRSPDGAEVDVDPVATTFRSGDRVRFAFDSNIDGYLYVVQQGSSGRWTVLFPGPRINGGMNAVRHGEQYQVPANDWFLFDATPGTEQIFVFLSREPMNQLPGFDRPVTKSETLTASVVQDLQNRIKSRDLVLETDPAPSAAAAGAVQATYVVNRTELGQAVSASITLSHTE